MTKSELEYPKSVQINVEESNKLTAEIKKNIETHRKAAENFRQAAKFHLEAAKHYKEGRHEKAYLFTIQAHAFSSFANEVLKKGLNFYTTMEN